MSYVYLASPYTDPSSLVREKRYIQVAKVTALYLKEKLWVYSPIVHNHELAKKYDLPKDFEFWKAYNYAMLESAVSLHILTLDGWEDSKGIRAELKKAQSLGLPVHLIDYPLVLRG